MQHTIFISCPCTTASRQLLDAAGENLVGVGLVGIGTEKIDGCNIFPGSSHPLMQPVWPDGSPSAFSGGSAAAHGLYQVAQKSGKLTVIATGPLTDIALCLCAHPDLPQFVGQLLILGGSDSYGDVTPAAERNFYNDPEAAQLVLKSGIPIVLFALNTTRDLPASALCPLRYLQEPGAFTLEPAGVYVETQGTITRGKSVNDLYSDKQFPIKNVHFVTAIAT